MTKYPRRSRGPLVTGALALFPFLLPALAHAAVTEPPIPPATTGINVPQPVPANEVSVATSRAFTAMDVTLQGLFANRGEAIDYIKDAQTTPGTFSPQCGFTGQLVLHGGSCRVGLGWYNATPGSTTPPPQNQIYMLVPPTFPKCPMPPMAIDPTMACCDDQDFCPLVTYDTTQTGQHRWSMPPFTADNIRADSRYKGGLIGFVLMGVGSPDGQCNLQNKYSELQLNQLSPSGKPWIGSVIYQSTAQPSSYYLCFEDVSTIATSWQGNPGAMSDGDFNDFVFYVSGISCKGGGKSCDTTMMGVCANGITQCSSGENISCTPIVKASAEVCDGLDNDCDGVVDQGTLCPDTFVCDKGKCVGKCGTGEFQCPPGLTCDSGYCKDPSCLNVDCPAGQVCIGGKCQGGCDAVVCPQGQSCVSGACLDLCAGVSCTGSQVCESGVCLASCDCRGCDTGQVCAGSHHCVDTGCDKQTCSGPAMVCVGGSCKDGCAGVTCPGGQQCSGGVCIQVAPTSTGGFSGVLVDAGTNGSGGITVLGGSGGRPGFLDGSADQAGGGSGAAPKISSCSCEAAGTGDGPAWLALGVIGFVAMRLRRRRS